MRILVRLLPACLAAGALYAQPNHPTGPCVEDLALNIALRQIPSITIPGVSPADLTALSVPGIPVDVSAGDSKLVVEAPGCHPSGSGDPISSFTWKLDVPVGSTARLVSTLPGPIAKFTPDVPGTYTVHFTACPNKCTARVVIAVNGLGKPVLGTASVGPGEKTMAIQVTNGAQVPPLLRPADHPVAAGLQATNPQPYSLPVGFCSGHAGLVFGDPEWFTTSTWTGATPPYELGEGRIYKSIVAGADFPFNHNNNDYNGNFDFDPPFQRLLISANSGTAEDTGALLPLGGMEMEWEFQEIPEEFRPVEGDRASALGFHVIDCGHDIYTEIHPVIAVAAHRRSAVVLPASVAFAQGDNTQRSIGQNVVVPGITTDVWINLNGGETLDGVERGLHQPRTVPVRIGDKVTQVQVSVSQPTTQGTTFTFRMYLPPNPAYVLQQYGITPAFKPALFWQQVAHPAAQKYQPLKTVNLQMVEQQLDGPTPYLRFSMDLSPLSTGDRAATRIEAAWVYPDLTGKNWGLQRMSVRLNELKVNDTGDFTSGDWKLWVNVSGASVPWIKLIDCHGCVEQKTYTGQSTLWEHGAMAGDGTLATSVARFNSTLPDRLEFTGYDEDFLSSDGISTLVVPFSNFPPAGSATTDGQPGDPSFTVTYSSISRADTGSVSGDAASFFRKLVIHPAMMSVLQPETEAVLYSVGPVNVERKKITTRQQDEEDDAGMQALRGMKKKEIPPGVNVDSLAQQLRKRILKLYGNAPAAASHPKVVARLQQIKPLFPAEVYRKYLCDLETGAACAVP